jgi:DNA-binding FrmR family transcriptional regulator
LLGQHLETCVRDAFATGDETVRDRQVAELMDIFGRYGGLPTR